jgi:hypothetical protein
MGEGGAMITPQFDELKFIADRHNTVLRLHNAVYAQLSAFEPIVHDLAEHAFTCGGVHCPRCTDLKLKARKAVGL